jgi:hypothetical protein
MLKKTVLAFMLSSTLIVTGCSSKDENMDLKSEKIENGKVSNVITIGEKISPFTLKDQFGKEHTLKNDTKKLIMVFTKVTGHTVKEYLKTKPNDYLSSKNMIFIADIHKMPSLIAKYVALPDLQKLKYPILLISDDKNAENFTNEKYTGRIMVVSLEDLVVKDVTLLNNVKDLAQLIK